MNLRQELYMNGFAIHEEDNGANPISVNYCICKLPPYTYMHVILLHTNVYKSIGWHLQHLALYLQNYYS